MLARCVSSIPSDSTKQKSSQWNKRGFLKTKDYWAETLSICWFSRDVKF